MKFEKEITVNVNLSRKELIDFLNKNNYILIDKYTLDDTYFVPNDIDLNLYSLDILKKCVLVRSIDDRKCYLVYKYKEYDDNENIINQGKSKLQVFNKDDAITFLKVLGYHEVIRIVDNIEVYEKDELQICVQYVNNKYLFIEMEENEKYNSIEKIIDALEKTKIDYDNSDYYVKKAKIIYEEKYKKSKEI